MYALRKTLTRGLFVLTVLSLLIAALPAAVTAQGDDNLIARLPPPSGEYVVGRTAYQWTDEAREEVHTEDPDDQRELLVEVWYPAAPEPDAEIGNYLELPMAMHYARMVNQESSVADVLAMQANAYPDAPLSNAQDTYPVVLFDPGFSVLPRRYTLLLEGIASHGYIVFAVSHPYVTSLTVMPDGRLIEPLDYNRLSSLWAPQDVYDGEYEGAWLPDMLFVLEQLDAIHADDPAGRFTGRLDLDGFGMIGHSQGSRVVSEVCLMDTRCAGAISLDGRRSPLVDLTMDRPYMAIMADNGVSQFVNEFEHGMESLGAGYYVMMILQTNHMSFVDDAYWLPLALGAPAGEIPVELALGQLALYDYRAYMVAFLDKHIRGEEVPLLDGPSEEFKEVFFFAREEPIALPTAEADPQPVILGEEGRGEVEVGTADVWTYQGQAGERLTLWVITDRPANATTHEERLQLNLMDSLLVVRGPEGDVLAINDDYVPGFTDSIIEDLDLPADGEYRFEVRTYGSMYAGSYSLLVTGGRGDPEA